MFNVTTMKNLPVPTARTNFNRKRYHFLSILRCFLDIRSFKNQVGEKFQQSQDNCMDTAYY